jgi:hypothetical protein
VTKAKAKQEELQTINHVTCKAVDCVHFTKMTIVDGQIITGFAGCIFCNNFIKPYLYAPKEA